jgi:hypothetical protein
MAMKGNALQWGMFGLLGLGAAVALVNEFAFHAALLPSAVLGIAVASLSVALAALARVAPYYRGNRRTIARDVVIWAGLIGAIVVVYWLVVAAG